MGDTSGLPRNLRRAQEYTLKAPKSKCRCGHTGDGANSCHANAVQYGHGRCLHPGCDCGQFTWGGWTKEFEQFVDE
jgi:hypothetical protein